MPRAPLAALSGLALLGCAITAEPVWAPDEAVARFAVAHEGPASVALVTVINNRSGEGGHTALFIRGSQRLVWDPAGSWWNPHAPERNDLHFGMTERMEEIYIDYHARTTWRVVIQELAVSREVADALAAAAQAYGAVPKAQCTLSTGRVLRSRPEFASAPETWFPKRLMAWFDTLPGVTRWVVYDDDDNNNQPLLRQQIAAAGGGRPN
jgi:hypothetical protein